MNKKKIFLIAAGVIVAIIAVFFFLNNSGNENENSFGIFNIDLNGTKESKTSEQLVEEMYDFDKNYGDRKIIVAYFSATGNTKIVAEKIAEIFECDTVEIEPVEPYTEFDLTSSDPSTRPMRESKYNPFSEPEETDEDADIDPNEVRSLPKIKRKNLNRYDTIILGYPIWYEDAPRVIYTFVSESNLKNKIIIPFCTSDSDSIDKSVNGLAAFSEGNFMSGKRFNVESTSEEIKEFFTEIGVDIDAWD